MPTKLMPHSQAVIHCDFGGLGTLRHGYVYSREGDFRTNYAEKTGRYFTRPI